MPPRTKQILQQDPAPEGQTDASPVAEGPLGLAAPWDWPPGDLVDKHETRAEVAAVGPERPHLPLQSACCHVM